MNSEIVKDIMNQMDTRDAELHRDGNSDKSVVPETKVTRAYAFFPDAPATVLLVEANADAVKRMALDLCSPLYRYVAEVAELHPSPAGLALFYTRPTKESGLGKNYRWKAAYGNGMDEFLLGPAILVAMNTNTREIRDFTSKEERRATSFDRRDYRRERMFDIKDEERVVLTKGEIAGIDSTDSIYIASQNWQLLTLRVEHGPRTLTVVIPKSRILSGEIGLIRYKDAEPIH